MTTNCSTNLYSVKFTDSRKDKILVSKGELITNRADIAFVGKTNRDYGEIFNENTLHLLENFACPEDGSNPGNPDLNTAFGSLLSNPIEGQVWYNTTTNRPFRYDGVNWLSLSTQCDIAGNYGALTHGETIPLPVCPVTNYQFTWPECTWIVSPLKYTGKIDYMRCATDSQGLVTMQYRLEGSGTLIEGYVNYQIIGIRGNNNMGSGGNDPLPVTPVPPANLPPTVTSPTHSGETHNSAVLGGTVVSDGGLPITERGIEWWTTASPTPIPVTMPGTMGPFTGSVTGLPPNTQIHFRAYAKNSMGTGTTPDSTFTTDTAPTVPVAPTVDTPTVTSITSTGATLGGWVRDDGNSPITQRGTVWATSPNPTIHPSIVPPPTTGQFSGPSAGTMPSNQNIYFRAYATNQAGLTGYSDDVTFTTAATATAPTVVGQNVISGSVTQSSAELGANVTSDGGDPILAGNRGIQWSANIYFSPATSVPHASGGTGVFSVVVTGLPSNTQIHYRGYAQNGVGLTYSGASTFNTASTATAPTVIRTFNPNNITHNSARVYGDVTSDGGDTGNWQRGVCYTIYPSILPTINNSQTKVEPGVTGAYNVDLTGLSPGTTYYYRMYARNSIDTGYSHSSAAHTFTTSAAPTAPTLNNPQASNIGVSSATLGATLVTTGGANITQRGIRWWTGSGPKNPIVVPGTSLGAFAVNNVTLPSSSTIHFEGYALNSAGLEGVTQTSTFNTIMKPTVITPTVYGTPGETSATLGATISNNGGGSVSSHGIVWSYSSSSNLTILNGTPVSMSGGVVGTPYSGNVTGFTPGTTVYYRGYATNAAGTGYSMISNFTTDVVDTSANVLPAQLHCRKTWPVGTTNGAVCGLVRSDGYISTNPCNGIDNWVEGAGTGFPSPSNYTYTWSVISGVDYAGHLTFQGSGNPSVVATSGSGNLGHNATWCLPNPGVWAGAESWAVIRVIITGPDNSATVELSIQSISPV